MIRFLYLFVEGVDNVGELKFGGFEVMLCRCFKMVLIGLDYEVYNFMIVVFKN